MRKRTTAKAPPDLAFGRGACFLVEDPATHGGVWNAPPLLPRSGPPAIESARVEMDLTRHWPRLLDGQGLPLFQKLSGKN